MAKVPDFGGETRDSIPAMTWLEDHALPVNKCVALQVLNIMLATVMHQELLSANKHTFNLFLRYYYNK